MVMELFEILDQVMDPLGIEELSRQLQPPSSRKHIFYLSDHLRWLGILNGRQILLHRTIKVALGIQIICISPVDGILLHLVHPRLLRQIDR